jgi:hypothetical protein
LVAEGRTVPTRIEARGFSSRIAVPAAFWPKADGVFRPIFLAFLILIAVSNPPATNAAEGDTVINIAVTVRTDRVRPSPSTGLATLRAVNVRKLGGKNENRFEVLGPDHLRRHSAGKTFTKRRACRGASSLITGTESLL